jgi:hypothetical protein
MRSFLTAAACSLLLAGYGGGAAQAQQAQGALPSASELTSASVTSNVPPRAGEASTMTNGVPNLLTSNAQPGELGLQTRLTVRKRAAALAGTPDLRVMGAAGATGPDGERAGRAP